MKSGKNGKEGTKLKRIALISGKGGTGKTFFVSALAAMAEGNALFADCDVDAANLALALGEARLMESTPFSGGRVAVINPELCTGCGECAAVCRFDALTGIPAVDSMACEGCGVCALVCPCGAVSWKEELSGSWMVSGTPSGVLVHAELEPGGENSGKLVHLVRKAAEKESLSRNIGHTLVDGPPGTGCPVLAAVSDTDAVVLISEPSPSAFHDLIRAAETVESFHIPVGVLVNKGDLNREITGQVEELCYRKGYRWIGSFPWNRQAAEASSSSESPFVLLDPEASSHLKKLCLGILDMVPGGGGRA
jgi:MinD superfamily P-loop ATPase